jgi:hypothetical protein
MLGWSPRPFAPRRRANRVAQLDIEPLFGCSVITWIAIQLLSRWYEGARRERAIARRPGYERTGAELSPRIKALPNAPLVRNAVMRMSLAGAQHKPAPVRQVQ